MRNHRKIPITLATQHPDNANAPYWTDSPFVTAAQEVEECFRSFSDLDCDEYMWDWEGKFVDEAVVDRLDMSYYDYFKKHPLGKEKFLTFRVPNIAQEGQARLSRAFMGILSASYTASQLGLHVPPLFEVIHPMTKSSSELLTLQKKFIETARFQARIFGVEKLQPEFLEIIPLIEGTGTLLKSRKILREYCRYAQRFLGKKLTYVRPFIARSDPALDGGFLAAVLSAKAALSEYFIFEKESGIKVYPMIGAGSLRFRGGLSPHTIEEFVSTYPGLSTVTLQSSFRYDHPLPEVKRAIRKLQHLLPDTSRKIFTPQQMQRLNELDSILVRHYRSTIEGLSVFINQIAKFIPARRERMQHIGHFGYSRQMGKAGLKLPRAITFTAVFYSLGIPPELIGLGRGLEEARQHKLLPFIEEVYPELRQVICDVGRYLNRENLDLLSNLLPSFKAVKKGLHLLESFIGSQLGPIEPDDFLHRNYTSNVVRRWILKQDFQEDILRAAQIRKSLG